MTHKNCTTDPFATLTDEECAELDWSVRSDAPDRDTGYGEGLMFACFAPDQWDEEQEDMEEDMEADMEADATDRKIEYLKV